MNFLKQIIGYEKPTYNIKILRLLNPVKTQDHEAADRLYVDFGGLNKKADPKLTCRSRQEKNIN